MNLTIATTTRDRRDSVLRLLASVAPQLQPDDELIVVDNGSKDGTADAVRAWFETHHPDGRLIVESEGGTSKARNTAIAASSAAIVCFLDDDTTVDPGWVAAMRSAWEQASPKTAMIGGPINPDWHGGTRPAWVSDHLLWIVTALNLGREPRRLERERIWGANMSLRVGPVNEIGGFDVNMGPRPGTSFGRDEEEDLQRRLQAQQFEIWWEPAASVQHHLPAARVDPAYFRAFMRSQAAHHVAQGNIRTKRAVYRSARTSVRYVLAWLLRNDRQRIAARISLAYWASALRVSLRS